MPGKSKFQISRSLDERIKRIIGGTNEYDSEFTQVSSAYILGFNYGNVTNCVGLTTNYQLHHAVFPVVGLVFFRSCPSDDDIKSSLKSVKEYSSSPNGLGSFKSDKNEHLFLIYSVDKDCKEVEKRIFNFTKGTFVRRRRLRLNVLDDPYCPRQVHRGSEDLFSSGDGDSLASADEDHIDHLIFFIHGVGGVCDVRFRSCVEVVRDFRKMANSLLAQQSNPSSGRSTPSNSQLSQHLKKGFFRKHSTESNTSRNSDSTEVAKSTPPTRTRRVECLPVSWHSCTRRQTGMNDQLSTIALSSVPKLRHFLNKVVIDALLYGSGPVYSQTIINNVGDEINRLYTLFMERHPNFDGTVSLAGHSLGSVIVFDLLANQIPREPAGSPSLEVNCDSSSTDRNRIDDDTINNNINTDNIRESDRCKRKCCRNVSHLHHDLTKTQLNSCSDYNSLEELLKDMNLMRYAGIFQKEHVDINTLLLLTDLDMKELNLPLGVRRQLGTYINFKKVSIMPPTPRAHLNTQQQKQPISSETKTKINNFLDNSNTGQFAMKYPQLKFEPKCFFSFGSPMPMFLNVRGIQSMSEEYKLPTCSRMLNIFHPYDPLAYRIEPLIDPRFKNIEPVQIPHHRGGKRIHVQLREGFARVGNEFKHRLLGSLRNTWTSFTRFNTTAPTEAHTSFDDQSSLETRRRLTKSASSSVDVEIESFDTGVHTPCVAKQLKKQLKRQQLVRSQSDLNITSLDSIIEGSARQNPDSESDTDANQPQIESLTLDERGTNLHPGHEPECYRKQAGPESVKSKDAEGCDDFDSTRIGRLNGGRRIDYVLQEKPIELFNEYIFAFTSHASYWQNEDSALIILNEIYQTDNIQMFEH